MEDNMKKSRLLSAFAGIALLIAGCSDLNDSGVVSGDVTDKSAQAQSKMITVNVTSESDLLTFPGASGASRTILPQAVNASDNTAVKFYLEYKDTLSNSPVSNPEEIAFTADTGSTTKGTLTKTFDVSVYSFTLYCVPASAAISNSTTAKNNAMFIGYANADLRYADTISFYMTAENATGKGTVDLAIYSSNENSTTDLWNVPAGYTVTAGIYSKVDNSLVYPTATPKSLISTSPLAAESAIEGAAFGGSSTAVDSGSYNFVVTFTDTTNNNKSYEWSDEIIILPNQKTDGNVFVPEVIEKKPDAPSSFFVAYADPLEKDAAFYYAEFAWSDNSNNERSFEIDLVDVSDNVDNTQGNATSYVTSAIPASDSDWSSALVSYTNPVPVTYDWEAYQKSQYNPNPGKYSLIKNNENAMFLLELGKRYLARIRAQNDVGYSDYAYLHIPAKKADGTYETGFADGTGTIEFTEDATNAPDATSSITVTNTDYSVRATAATALTMNVFDEGSFTVNRFRIRYNLMDGELVGDEDAATPGTYTALADAASDVVYKTQHVGATGDPAGEYIMNPDGNAAKSKYLGTDGTEKEDVLNLIKTDPSGTRKFKRWLLKSGNDEGNGVSPTGNWYPATPTGTAPATRDEPDAYTGHTNLELYASYAVDSTLNVEIADYTAYNWADDDIMLNYKKVGETAADDYPCKSGGYVQISASTTGTITFKLQESTKEYDNVSLVIRSTSQKSGNGFSVDWVRTNATYDDTATPPAWSASPAAFDVNVKPFKPGKYECYLIGTSKKYPNKQYKYTLTIDLVD